MTRAVHRAVLLAVTLIPCSAFVAAIALSWSGAVGWSDLALFVVFYVAVGAGVTLGYHRMLTHRAFEAVRPLRIALLVLGAMSLQGSPIDWALDHRRHHARADREGDPHSPHHGFGEGLRGILRGLAHAHVGWLFARAERHDDERRRAALAKDDVVRLVDRTFLLWSALGFVLPFALGWALGGSLRRAWTGLLWGGFVRLFLNHHVTWSVNSICHVAGHRPFVSRDRSTNNWLLALPSLGEAWHHNHHVFPSSAFHGLTPRQIDPSGWLVTLCERIGLVRNVCRVTPEQIRRREAAQRGAQPNGAEPRGGALTRAAG